MAVPFLAIASVVGTLLPDAIRLVSEIKAFRKNKREGKDAESKLMELEESFTKQAEMVVTLTEALQKLTEELQTQAERNQRNERTILLLKISSIASLAISLCLAAYLFFVK
jgi:uncharacterized membrane-anchored protein YhcB (DUF1043 family)